MDLRHDPTLAFAPSSGIAPHGCYGAATPSVKAFFNRLRRVPLEAWARCAERASYPEPLFADVAPLPTSAELVQLQLEHDARARLDDVMSTMPDVARRIGQRIDINLAVAERIASRRAVARMRKVARVAAFALAARPALSGEEFERLYRPFSALISPADLPVS